MKATVRSAFSATAVVFVKTCCSLQPEMQQTDLSRQTVLWMRISNRAEARSFAGHVSVACSCTFTSRWLDNRICALLREIHYTRFPVTSPYTGKLPTCHGLVADLLVTRPTSPQQAVVMEFGKRHDTTDTTDFCPRQLVMDLLRENWCNGFWPYHRYLSV